MHKHRWYTKSETYTPPAAEGNIKNADSETALFFFFGITVAKQQCGMCGLIRYSQTPGRSSPDV